MTPQELKASILQMAIQGKLVKQRPEEGTSEDLYRQIQAEKQHLIKVGTIKKEKSLPEISEGEFLFDIPETWKWVRLGTVVKNISAGGDKPTVFSKSKTIECPVPVISNGETNKGIFGYTNTAEITERSLTVSGRGTIGYAEIRTEPYVPIVRLLVILPLEHTYLEYIKLAIQSSTEYGIGSAVKQLTVPMLTPKLIPLPPLAEQKRIVAKIEELLPYIDRYEQAWSKLEDFNKRFPVDMQKSILQTAIQGKLVEQRPEEGTGEELYQQIQAKKRLLIKQGNVYREKKLSDIDETELPFEIPESWKWCKLGELTKLITKGSSPKWQGISYTDKEHGVLFVTSENVGNEKIILSKEKYVEKGFNDMHPSSVLQNGDLLTNIVGASIGRSALFDLDIDNANTNQAVCIIRLVNQDIARYILKYLNSSTAIEMMTKKSVDSARANLSLTSVTNLLIPLPPLSEQKRIVAKLEELLPLCDRLK